MVNGIYYELLQFKMCSFKKKKGKTININSQFTKMEWNIFYSNFSKNSNCDKISV